MRTGVVVALLLTGIALAGCSAGNEDSGDVPAGFPLTVASNTTAPLPNQVPLAELLASAVNGTAPFNVTFNMTGSDPDADNLTWTLDADGDEVMEANGTTLPANFTHTYSLNGTFNATFTVSDGTNATVSTVSIEVTAGEAVATASGPIQSYEADWLLGAPGCALVITASGSPNDGVTGAARDVDPATWGRPFIADFSAFSPDNLGAEMFFFIDGERQDPLGVDADPGIIEGIVPEGANLIAYRNCGGQGMSVSYSAG